MGKQTRKTIEVACDQCGTHFEKAESELKRSIKNNRRNFCSRSCSSKSNLGNFNKVRNTNSEYLSPGNRRDDYTLFRPHLRRVQKRNQEYSITLQDMLEVWEKQNGICIYSKVNLIECKNIGINDPIYTMSLDRIDSNIGYTKENIQFISIAMNHLKNSMTHSKMMEMLVILKR